MLRTLFARFLPAESTFTGARAQWHVAARSATARGWFTYPPPGAATGAVRHGRPPQGGHGHRVVAGAIVPGGVGAVLGHGTPRRTLPVADR